MSTDSKKKSSGIKKTEGQEGKSKRKKSIIKKPADQPNVEEPTRLPASPEESLLIDQFFEQLPKGFEGTKINGEMVGGYVPSLIKELLKLNAQKNYRNMSQELLRALTFYLEHVLPKNPEE
jgi:hypothetical protein